MPCAAIHERSCGIVRRTTVHRIHLPARPLMWKLIPPSCRRLTPAGGQSAERRGNRQIEQQLQQVEKELRHRHPALLTECLAPE